MIHSAGSAPTANLDEAASCTPRSLEQFRQLAAQGNLIPVARQILADMETPVSAFRKIDSGNYAFLLESVEGGEQWGRYSFLGSNPSLVVRAQGSGSRSCVGTGREVLADVHDPFTACGRSWGTTVR